MILIKVSEIGSSLSDRIQIGLTQDSLEFLMDDEDYSEHFHFITTLKTDTIYAKIFVKPLNTTYKNDEKITFIPLREYRPIGKDDRLFVFELKKCLRGFTQELKTYATHD